nr:DapH/DapD/GlmU-related protein [Rhodococcus koreensis]
MKGLLYKETSEESQVQIGDNVWIGSNVTILPGVSIGNGAVIGAGAVVARDLPDYVLAVGVPARVIRSLIRPIP